MEYLLPILEVPSYHPYLSFLWFFCLLAYLMGPAGWGRNGLCATFYLALGYVAVWFPLYQAGGTPSFFGEWSNDVRGWAFFEWIILVCPSGLALVVICYLADHLLRPSDTAA
ncbi:hypothetical protein JST97_03130 [bacterium]|nr:hypothetical protein [bacterium]